MPFSHRRLEGFIPEKLVDGHVRTTYIRVYHTKYKKPLCTNGLRHF